MISVIFFQIMLSFAFNSTFCLKFILTLLLWTFSFCSFYIFLLNTLCVYVSF